MPSPTSFLLDLKSKEGLIHTSQFLFWAKVPMSATNVPSRDKVQSVVVANVPSSAECTHIEAEHSMSNKNGIGNQTCQQKDSGGKIQASYVFVKLSPNVLTLRRRGGV
jgi:hypothetical protein